MNGSTVGPPNAIRLSKNNLLITEAKYIFIAKAVFFLFSPTQGALEITRHH
jgi:hypothetical protein